MVLATHTPLYEKEAWTSITQDHQTGNLIVISLKKKKQTIAINPIWIFNSMFSFVNESILCGREGHYNINIAYWEKVSP